MFNNESFSIKDLFNKTFKKSDQDKYQGSNLGLRIKESIKVDNQEYTLTVDTNRVPTEKEWNEEKIAFIKQVATEVDEKTIGETKSIVAIAESQILKKEDTFLNNIPAFGLYSVNPSIGRPENLPQVPFFPLTFPVKEEPVPKLGKTERALHSIFPKRIPFHYPLLFLPQWHFQKQWLPPAFLPSVPCKKKTLLP